MSRYTIAFFVAAGVALASAHLAEAKNFPTREVIVVVPWEPGGRTDAGARIWTPTVGEILGVPSIVENKPGGGGMMGAREVLRDNEGYSVGLFSATHIMAQWTRVPPLELNRYAPVALLYSQPFTLAVRADSGIKSVSEFIAAAKKRRMRFGSGSVGGSNHIAAAAFAHTAELNVQHIPYQGDAGVIAALLGKEIDAAMMPLSGVAQQIESRELVALAVSLEKVDQAHKGLKTFREQGVDFVISDFSGGIFIPKTAPDEAVAKWRAALAKTMQDERVKERLAKLAITPDYVEGKQFQAMLEKWNPVFKKLVEELGLRISK